MIPTNERLVPGCTVEILNHHAHDYNYEIYVGAEAHFDGFIGEGMAQVTLPNDKVLLVQISDCKKV